MHCYNKEKGNGAYSTAETHIRPFSNVLGARTRENKEGEAEKDMAKYIPRRPGRDGC